MDQGLLYFAKGKAFVAEAEQSAQRAATVMPEYPIAIVTDREPDADCFNAVILDESPFEKRDKPRALRRTPYDRTIYLDTDTYLSDSVDELFEILDAFEFGLRRDREQAHVPEDSPLPDAFPEFNSGVTAYRSTAAVIDCSTIGSDAVCPRTTSINAHYGRRCIIATSDLRLFPTGITASIIGTMSLTVQ